MNICAQRWGQKDPFGKGLILFLSAAQGPELLARHARSAAVGIVLSAKTSALALPTPLYKAKAARTGIPTIAQTVVPQSLAFCAHIQSHAKFVNCFSI